MVFVLGDLGEADRGELDWTGEVERGEEGPGGVAEPEESSSPVGVFCSSALV